MNANPNDPLDNAFTALRQRPPESLGSLRNQLDATIPTQPRKDKTMFVQISLAIAACSTLLMYVLGSSMAQPIPYVKTIQQMRELPYFHIRFRERTNVRENDWLSKDIWFDQARGLRIGPLSPVSISEEMLMLPNDTLYWKNGNQISVLRGQGSWKSTYEAQLKSVQDFPLDNLAQQAIPAKATPGQWEGRRVYIYNLKLAPGNLAQFARLFIDSRSHLLIAQQRTIKVGMQEIIKEEYRYDYDRRPDATYFDVALFNQGSTVTTNSVGQ